MTSSVVRELFQKKLLNSGTPVTLHQILAYSDSDRQGHTRPGKTGLDRIRQDLTAHCIWTLAKFRLYMARPDEANYRDN